MLRSPHLDATKELHRPRGSGGRVRARVGGDHATHGQESQRPRAAREPQPRPLGRRRPARDGLCQPTAGGAGRRRHPEGGWSCVDAAIATNAALGLMEPASCGIGGDLFAIVWVEKERRLYGLNASGRAPAGWTLDEARKRNLDSIPALEPPLPGSVPGCVSGWSLLSERFGRLSLARVLEPAIGYAREGFPVSPIIASQFDGWKRRAGAAPGGGLPPGRTGTRLWRRVREPPARGVVRAHREGRRARLLRGRDRGTHRREVARAGRLHELRGPAPAPLGLGRAGFVVVPRLRRLGDPAERPGHLRAADR